MKKIDGIGFCSNCERHRPLYKKMAVKIKDTMYTIEAKKACCQKCFEKEIKRQLKEGAAHVG